MEHLLFEAKCVLVTGGIGFIGFHVCKSLLEQDLMVIVLDNLNDYYDVKLKMGRLSVLKASQSFIFIKGDLEDNAIISEIFMEYHPEIVLHLGAQAGVRYSIEHPQTYINSNIIGFFNILEACRHSTHSKFPVRHLVFASSSSVYGLNKKIPYSVADKVDRPVSLYAATKKSNELMAHAYSKLYNISITGLRFFTVYGPMGRPDMAYFSFTEKMIRREKIQLFNYGNMFRDFTYIDDIVEGILKVMDREPKVNEDGIKYKVYNIGNNKPESLTYFVDVLERCLIEEGMIDNPVPREFLPMQPGDVYQTYADIDEMIRDFDFSPRTNLEDGIKKFVDWYKNYYS